LNDALSRKKRQNRLNKDSAAFSKTHDVGNGGGSTITSAFTAEELPRVKRPPNQVRIRAKISCPKAALIIGGG
jgi:hypothetical protein